jgi:nicotinate (nicotinamide) nucleotide adenylyltransferase
MEFLHRSAGTPARLAIFPGTFNPLTTAHHALMRAALAQVDEVVVVLPRVFPHKEYVGATFAARAEMLCSIVGPDDPISVAASDRGLFVEIAAECREAYGPEASLAFLCGRDAAERIAGWDYGRSDAFAEMLRQFDLLVAGRQGEYEPPEHLPGAIRRLEVSGDFSAVSASDVRRRISRGEPWEHLVPSAIREIVRKVYR